MYPFVRAITGMLSARRQSTVGLLETTVTHHRVWPWDGDIFMELNHGRTLTLFELGRWPQVVRMGLTRAVRSEKIAFAVAGVSVRYRRRLPIFAKFRMVTRILGWDERFIYIDQTMWQGDRCANQMLLRAALKTPQGTLSPAEFLERIGEAQPSPTLPDWVQNWINAERTRPWPPEHTGLSD